MPKIKLLLLVFLTDNRYRYFYFRVNEEQMSNDMLSLAHEEIDKTCQGNARLNEIFIKQEAVFDPNE